MGKTTGFLEEDRKLPGTIKPAERIKNYREFYKEPSKDLANKQASRCMDCGVPFCHTGCPLGNLIPDFNDAVYHEHWEKAVEILLSTNNFPEFTGRICPAPCEGSCVLGINKPAVAIEFIEKSIIEKAFDLDLIKPKSIDQRKPQTIAVIGSGPAGLAAADQLNFAGYHVTVFERDENIGGLLRFGIPDFKLSKDVVERRVKLMKAEGIEFKTACSVGTDVLSTDVLRDFDAIVLCTGSTVPNDLNIDGRDLKGVHFAMDFLTQQNRRVSDLPVEEEDILATGKNVVVIGGGDTGSDCIGTSNRQGAKSITQFELLSKPPVHRKATNPWPEWPLVLRESSSHEEGAQREWSVMTKSFKGNSKGELTGIETVEIEWEDGNFREVPGTEKVHPCELALLAIGFAHTEKEGMINDLGLQIDTRGNLITNDYQTSIPKVFAAGDNRRGQSLVVWAISEGREAARSVDIFLSGSTTLPSKNASNYLM
jgi:glutamate synthase (NADPH/NADH) small chain